jgi:hypothetical protein
MNRHANPFRDFPLWAAVTLGVTLASCTANASPAARAAVGTEAVAPAVTASKPLTLFPGLTSTPETPQPIREISYYPRDYAWMQFWKQWPEAKLQMQGDLDRIRAMGFNTVRIFLHPDTFGYPVPAAAALGDFEDALALIATHGLRAHVNLFDCWQSWEDIDGSRTWLAAVVGPHRDDDRIAVWELRNEVGLDQPLIRDWVRALFPELKAQAGNTPATVSVSEVEWLDDVADLTGSTPPDLYSLHWYPDDPVRWTRTFPETVRRARELIGAADLLIGETGLSTFTYSDADQADLFHDIMYYAGREGIADWGFWTLNDFPPGTAGCGGEPPRDEAEWYFGLYRADGSPKPAVSVMQSALHGRPPSGLSPAVVMNPSFEGLNLYSGRLDDWWPWDVDWTSQVWGVQDCAVARSGGCSLRLAGPGSTAVGMYNVPALPVEAGKHYSLEAYVRTKNLQGRAWLSFSWFDADNQWLGGTSGPGVTKPALGEWERISIDGATPPPGTVSVQVFVQMESTLADSYVWFDDVAVSIV